jgi:hypothetical protein
MAEPALFTDIDAQSCRQRLLDAGRPGYLAVGTDGTNELAAWAPSSPGAPPSAVFCKIVLKPDGDGSKIIVSTCSSSLARTGVMCWTIYAGFFALRFGLMRDGNTSFDRLLAPLGYAFTIALIVMARVLDGRTVKQRVLDLLRRELNVRATAAD